ncbi:MAG: hypothetical protein O7D91_11180 [Planctomycetota bacterium]|nr:hypothetical protein [Planctomycetota bacterium]
MDSTTTQQSEALAVDVRGMSKLVPFSVRTLRRMDSSGKIPRGHRVGGKKLWKLNDLKLWATLGFPDREEFEARMESVTN